MLLECSNHVLIEPNILVQSLSLPALLHGLRLSAFMKNFALLESLKRFYSFFWSWMIDYFEKKKKKVVSQPIWGGLIFPWDVKKAKEVRVHAC